MYTSTERTHDTYVINLFDYMTRECLCQFDNINETVKNGQKLQFQTDTYISAVYIAVKAEEPVINDMRRSQDVFVIPYDTICN